MSARERTKLVHEMNDITRIEEYVKKEGYDKSVFIAWIADSKVKVANKGYEPKGVETYLVKYGKVYTRRRKS